MEEEEEDVEVETADDDDDDEEEPQEEEVEPQPLNEYLDGARDLSVLTQYHLHVAYCMSDGVVKFYNFNFFVQCFFFM